MIKSNQKRADYRPKDKKLRGKLSLQKKKDLDQALKVRDSAVLLEQEEGFLEEESALERTYKVSRSLKSKSVFY